MVRASYRSSEGCGFDPRLGLRNHFLSTELEDHSSVWTYYVNWIQLPEHFAAVSFSCKHWIPKVNGKTIAPINITNKISKGILAVVFSRWMRGTFHYVCVHIKHMHLVYLMNFNPWSVLENKYFKRSCLHGFPKTAKGKTKRCRCVCKRPWSGARCESKLQIVWNPNRM